MRSPPVRCPSGGRAARGRPFERVSRATQQHLCVFCGCSRRPPPRLADAARAGQAIAAGGGRGCTAGGKVGMMGAVADGALEAGGRKIGVRPRPPLVQYEVAHGGLTELHVVASMHVRKQMMAHHADAFVIPTAGRLPGTMVEELLQRPGTQGCSASTGAVRAPQRGRRLRPAAGIPAARGGGGFIREGS
ncbi:MAG: LOG family protein [Gemmatimonadetes bacterium]|nr:LOG family protein [Gemmatimonadota bacterium]